MEILLQLLDRHFPRTPQREAYTAVDVLQRLQRFHLTLKSVAGGLDFWFPAEFVLMHKFYSLITSLASRAEAPWWQLSAEGTIMPEMEKTWVRSLGQGSSSGGNHSNSL